MKRPVKPIEETWLKKDPEIHWTKRGAWPAYWLKWGGETPEDTISFYRLEFISSEQEVLDFLVSGDNRYKLFLDGKQIASGPETGHLNSYFYNRIQVTTGKGNHTLTAMVFDFKEYASYAHVSLRPGFLLAAADIAMRDRFNTGFAPWEVQSDNSMVWSDYVVLYPAVRFHASHRNSNLPWRKAEIAEQAWFAGIRNEYPVERLMVEGTLLPQISDSNIIKTEKVFICDPEKDKLLPLLGAENIERDFFNFCNGKGSLTIPPESKFKALGMMDNYYCLYPVLQTLGGKGAEITLTFAEACHENKEWLDDIKHNREEIWGKYIRKCYNNADIFYPDSSQFEFFTPHWRSGRFFAFEIKTGSEELVLQNLSFTETRYPLEAETTMFSSDPALNAILPLCWRTLQMCTHETYMDCPYYEQLMYAGDSRLEALVTMTGTSDDRMVKKMLSIFADSQMDSGFLHSRFPCRITQIIPTFSLLWIGSLYDFARMRNDKKFVQSMMGTMHKILSAYEERINSDGLLEFAQGWNFVDWVPEWCASETNAGTPPYAEFGVSTVINMLYIYALKMAAGLCEYTGAPEIAAFYNRKGRELAANILKHRFDRSKGLFTEDFTTGEYCEHSQCLALLSGFMPPETENELRENLFNGKTELLQTTIYFSHYYFETCNLTGRTDAFFKRLQLWSDNIKSGLKTLLERPDPSRSDCHAWSSHPYYHTAATLAGIRPAAFGFAKVRIEPHPGDLTTLHGEMMHPSGKITADYKFSGTAMQCRIELPPEVSGTLIWQNKEYPLKGGINEYNINTAE